MVACLDKHSASRSGDEHTDQVCNNAGGGAGDAAVAEPFAALHALDDRGGAVDAAVPVWEAQLGYAVGLLQCWGPSQGA